ncbi:MAG: CARDB domain-containing protein [Solirubrobacterales bacterium]
MEFFDEDPPPSTATDTAPPSPPRLRGGRRQPRPPRQQIMARRAMAVGAGLLVLVLLVLGVRGCLNARKERALRDYGQNVAAIVDESRQISTAFFRQLDDAGSLSVTEYTNDIASHRSGLDSLLQRTQQLDVPGDMKSAQRAFELTMQLRRNALTNISNSISTALGDEGREGAVDKIAFQMKAMLASDVLYRQVAKPEMEAALSSNGIDDVTIPPSKFLPDDSWLDSSTVEDALSGVSGAAEATPGIHGLGLIQTSANGTVVEEGVPATVSAGGQPELEVEVQNQGDSDESGVTVSVTVDGGQPIEQQINAIAAGETATVRIPITPAPRGAATLEVEVEPVPGEQVSDNNVATYEVTFQ